MSPHSIRTFGDPVLKTKAADVTDIDGRFIRLHDDMLTTMYGAPGIGLAAPQVGVKQRFFVYDLGEPEDGETQPFDGPGVLINPIIVEGDGEWAFEEGCLSIPGLSWEIIRPKTIHVVAIDLEGNEISFEADELFARLIQHEVDHLDGVLLLEHLNDDQRKEAKKILRERALDSVEACGPTGDLRLP